MSLRDDLAGVLARDPRYPIGAYAFLFEALEYTKNLKYRAREHERSRGKATGESRHVTGRELCEGARQMALNHYGLLAITVLATWGIRSTSDLGELVYNLIASLRVKDGASSVLSSPALSALLVEALLGRERMEEAWQVLTLVRARFEQDVRLRQLQGLRSLLLLLFDPLKRVLRLLPSVVHHR